MQSKAAFQLLISEVHRAAGDVNCPMRNEEHCNEHDDCADDLPDPGSATGQAGRSPAEAAASTESAYNDASWNLPDLKPLFISPL